MPRRTFLMDNRVGLCPTLSLLDHELVEGATDGLAAAVTGGNLAIGTTDVPGPVVGKLTLVAV